MDEFGGVQVQKETRSSFAIIFNRGKRYNGPSNLLRKLRRKFVLSFTQFLRVVSFLPGDTFPEDVAVQTCRGLSICGQFTFLINSTPRRSGGFLCCENSLNNIAAVHDRHAVRVRFELPFVLSCLRRRKTEIIALDQTSQRSLLSIMAARESCRAGNENEKVKKKKLPRVPQHR